MSLSPVKRLRAPPFDFILSFSLLKDCYDTVFCQAAQGKGLKGRVYYLMNPSFVGEADRSNVKEAKSGSSVFKTLHIETCLFQTH